MKLSQLLPFVAASSALVIPPEQVIREIQIEPEQRSAWFDKLAAEKDRLLANTKDALNERYEQVAHDGKDAWDSVSEKSSDFFDCAYEQAAEEANELKEKIYNTAENVHSWAESELDDIEATDGHHGHHGHGDHKPNQTVYELINSSKYSTKLAKLINEYPDIVKGLNSTKHNVTVFAPTDKAFEKIPDKVFEKLSKKEIEHLLEYHVLPGLYPAGRVLFTHTAPTLMTSDSLSDKTEQQRVSIHKGLRGITVNFLSRVVAVNIFGTNGVIHGVDTPIFPPIGAIREIALFPGAFSTLQLGLDRVGLLDELNTTDHAGGTLFAPNNDAFAKLGPKINAFLFSEPGRKYLKALLQYHIVPENTLYSDAYYHPDNSDAKFDGHDHRNIHVDLPTALEDRSLAIDIASYGPITTIKVNGFNRVSVQDVIAEDGVIHVVSDVIIPPRKASEEDQAGLVDEELTVKDLVERLDPHVSKSHKLDL